MAGSTAKRVKVTAMAARRCVRIMLASNIPFMATRHSGQLGGWLPIGEPTPEGFAYRTSTRNPTAFKLRSE